MVVWDFNSIHIGKSLDICPFSDNVSLPLVHRIQDNLDINSSLVFGDEMFTEDAAAAAAGTSSTAATPTPGSLSRGSIRPQNSGRFTPSTPQGNHRSKAGDSSRQSGDGNRDDDDATPTPSRSARRKSASRRSFTSGNEDSMSDMYGRTSGANTPLVAVGSFEAQRSLTRDDATNASSENIARRSANLRRGITNSGRAGSRTSSSPLPPTAMIPTPPPPVTMLAGQNSSSSVESGGAAPPRSAGAVSARSAQLSRRGLRMSSEQTPTPSLDSGLPSNSQRLSSASTRGDHREKPTMSGRTSSSISQSGSFPNASSDQGPLPSKPGVPRQPTSVSRHGTKSSSGLRRHASDIDTSTQQSHSRPASMTQRQQTPVQQWRPNSSTGERIFTLFFFCSLLFFLFFLPFECLGDHWMATGRASTLT